MVQRAVLIFQSIMLIMKQYMLFILLSLCVMPFGCDAGPEVQPIPEGPFALEGLEGEKIVYVADRTEECVGVAVQQCLLVKENPEDAWEFWYGGITGFTYAAGTNYVLRITEKEIADPPADGSSLEWVWVETLDTW